MSHHSDENFGRSVSDLYIFFAAFFRIIGEKPTVANDVITWQNNFGSVKMCGEIYRGAHE